MGNFFKTIELMPEPKLQVYFFHHAGAGAVQYFKIMRVLPQEFQVHVAELPGRGLRADEAFVENFDDLIDQLSKSFIQNLPTKPFVFIGHSMGSYIAMDLYRELKLKKLPLPELFICTSSNPPIQEYHYRRERLSKLNDHEFLDKLVSYDMLPKKLLQNPEFLDFFIPAIRADLKLFDEDSYIPNLQMECPIFGMYGDRDIVIHPDLKNHWQSFTQKGYSEETFRGGHFFFLEDIPNYTQSLLRKLRNLEK